MFILLDIGNTRATTGIYAGGRLRQFGSCSYDEIPAFIGKCMKSGRSETIYVVLSSVVPNITQNIKKAILPQLSRRRENVHLWVAGENLPVPIRHKYRNQKKLGIDRLVNLYGAMRIYKAPLLMVDFGTAITFDYLSAKGVFEGGMIVPGPEISFQTLLKRAAMIPDHLRLPAKTAGFLGKNTYDCIRSGTLEGYGAMTDGLIQRFRARFGKNLKVVATGGFAETLKPFAPELKVVDPQHSIKSLLLLAKGTAKRGRTP